MNKEINITREKIKLKINFIRINSKKKKENI